MKLLRRAIAAAALYVCASAGPAAAAGDYVHDGPGLLQKSTVDALNAKIDALHDKTGKAVVVDIVDSLDGKSARDYAAADFQKYQVNGVMIFVSKNPKNVGVIGDKNSQTIFPPGSLSNVRMTIRASFRQGQYDEGVTNGVNSIVDTYQGHAGTLQQKRGSRAERDVPGATSAYVESRGGGGPNWWLIIGIGLVIFFIIRAVTRSNNANYYNQNTPGGMGYGGPGGFGGGGFGGGGFGGGGGGGGFFSGLLGGLGGAFLGNQLFGNHGEQNNGGFFGGGGERNDAPQAENYDASAFQNDAGQADMGNASFGDWGDSGGGGGDAGGSSDDNSGW